MSDKELDLKVRFSAHMTVSDAYFLITSDDDLAMVISRNLEYWNAHMKVRIETPVDEDDKMYQGAVDKDGNPVRVTYKWVDAPLPEPDTSEWHDTIDGKEWNELVDRW